MNLNDLLEAEISQKRRYVTNQTDDLVGDFFQWMSEPENTGEYDHVHGEDLVSYIQEVPTLWKLATKRYSMEELKNGARTALKSVISDWNKMASNNTMHALVLNDPADKQILFRTALGLLQKNMDIWTHMYRDDWA